MGVRNKKSNDLPFLGIMSIAKPTLYKGDIAHGHYTLFALLHSISTANNSLSFEASGIMVEAKHHKLTTPY